ncbi:MAG: hypothetical protein ACTSPE_13515 [Candidatus Thorarchaeota archaeon]
MGLIVLVFIIGLIIYAVFLGIALGFVNGENREIGSTFVTGLLMAIVGVIPFIGCTLQRYFIKT